MQLLKDAVPHTSKVAVLLNPDQPYDQAQWRQLEIAARALKVTLQQLAARRASEFVGTFAAINGDRPDALLVSNTSFSFVNRRLIIDLAHQFRLPAISPFREHAEDGGLISYGSVRIERFTARGPLRRQDSERCETGRSSGRATDQIRACYQSQDCQISQPRNSA